MRYKYLIVDTWDFYWSFACSQVLLWAYGVTRMPVWHRASKKNTVQDYTNALFLPVAHVKTNFFGGGSCAACV